MDRTARHFVTAAIALAAPAAAENLLVNADLHLDRSDWTVDIGENPAWSSADESGCAGSGSIEALSEHVVSVIHWVRIFQCRPLPAGIPELSLVGSFRSNSLFPDVSLGVAFHDDLACEGPQLVGYGATATPPAVETWATIAESGFAVPTGAVAYEFVLDAITSASFVIQFDRLYLGPGEPVFRDDFEADSDGASAPCRWAPQP